MPGSAHMAKTMNTACPMLMPASCARPAKPICAVQRIRPGTDATFEAPVRNQRRRWLKEASGCSLIVGHSLPR